VKRPRDITLALALLASALSFHPGYSSAQAAPSIFVGTGHDYTDVQAVAFSDDGRFFATGANDETLRLWDLATRKEIREFIGHRHFVDSVAFAPDGKHLVSGAMDNTIRLWDMASGELVKTYEHDENWVRTLAVSRDSRLIASGNEKGIVELFDYASGAWLKNLAGHGGAVTAVAFSPDGKTLASSSNDGTMRLWDLRSGRTTRVLSPGAGALSSAVFSPDGRSILAGAADGTARLWDIASGRELRVFKGHAATVNSVAFTRDGWYVLTGSDDRTVKLWDAASGEALRSINTVEKVISFALSPGGDCFLAGHGSDVVNSYIGGYCAFDLWDLKSGARIALKGPVSQSRRPFSFVDGHAIYDHYKVLDFAEGRIKEADAGLLAKEAADSFSRTRTVSPDGRLVASTSGTGASDSYAPESTVLHLYDAASGKELRSFAGHAEAIRCVAFTPDGKRIVTGSMDKTIKVWSVESGKKLLTLAGSNSWVESLAISRGGDLLLSGANLGDEYIRLWDLSTGVELKSFSLMLDGRFHQGSWSVAFSPDEKRIVSGQNDGSVILRDLGASRAVRSFAPHSQRVTQVSFTPGGDNIVSSSADGTVRIWNVDDGNYVAYLYGSGSDRGKWLVYTNDGYWDGSRDCGDLVAMVRGLEVWNIDQFAVRNNRPDIILQRLGSPDLALIDHYRAQYQKRLRRLGMSEADLSAEYRVPTAAIQKLEQAGKFAELSLKFAANGKPLTRYNVYVNDVPLFGSAGKPISGASVTITERVELTSGDNKIEVSCLDSGGAESLRAPALARWEGKVAPNLYYLAFGVSDYADPKINKLLYAAKDAVDLGSAFKAMEGSRYGKVFAKVLTNAQVTKEAILAAKDFLKGARPDDAFVLFISGHGVQVGGAAGQSTYYYVTSNARLADIPGSAIDFDEIEALLQGIGPRQKLFLMDTCESGETDESGQRVASLGADGARGLRARALSQEASRGLSIAPKTVTEAFTERDRWIYNDLLRRSGTIVFSSSRGTEASLESDEWKQGAFTYEILKALRSRAADANGDGVVSVDELRTYVSAEVAKLTKDRQHPTVDRDNLFAKFGFPLGPAK